MIVIRRMVDRQRSYTGIFLPGEPPRIFPTTDFEHGRILQIYKQDKPYEGIINDFTYDTPPPTGPASPRPRQQSQPRRQHKQTRQKRRP